MKATSDTTQAPQAPILKRYCMEAIIASYAQQISALVTTIEAENRPMNGYELQNLEESLVQMLSEVRSAQR